MILGLKLKPKQLKFLELRKKSFKVIMLEVTHE